jgi:hypothetical protein
MTKSVVRRPRATVVSERVRTLFSEAASHARQVELPDSAQSKLLAEPVGGLHTERRMCRSGRGGRTRLAVHTGVHEAEDLAGLQYYALPAHTPHCEAERRVCGAERGTTAASHAYAPPTPVGFCRKS